MVVNIDYEPFSYFCLSLQYYTDFFIAIDTRLCAWGVGVGNTDREDLAWSEWVASDEEMYIHRVSLQPAPQSLRLTAVRPRLWSTQQVCSVQLWL